MASLDEIKISLQNAGIVGAGGAGFPSYAKLAPGEEILLINAAECEPMLYTDFQLMHEKMAQAVEGARLIMEEAGMTQCLFGIKAHNCKALGLSDGQELGKGCFVKQLPDVYPMGDEINLIYQCTGRLVQPGQLPVSQHVIVFNMETLCNAREAILHQKPLTEKYLTINGDIPNPVVVHVPIGMRVSELLDRLHITIPEEDVLMDGGPSMGRIIHPNTAVITKTTKGLIVIPKETPAVRVKMRGQKIHRAIASSVCCQCTRCTDMCPRHALGYPLEPHMHVRVASGVNEVMPESVLSASLCCSCGICEIAACCQYISPRAVILDHKSILAQNKLHFSDPSKEYHVREDRSYTMMSTERWKDFLGITRYDKTPVFHPELMQPDRVEIPMHQHIGSPSVPCVREGDTVAKGTRIAECGPGLSIPQAASIDGRVTYVDQTKIIIEKIN
ncbi:MAG: hypothetical protein IJU20_06140 [Clostridia bacterium]|nr:hypothetical protein [Clostridia bacterium]